jgi:hypothetical protein
MKLDLSPEESSTPVASRENNKLCGREEEKVLGSETLITREQQTEQTD